MNKKIANTMILVIAPILLEKITVFRTKFTLRQKRIHSHKTELNICVHDPTRFLYQG